MPVADTAKKRAISAIQQFGIVNDEQGPLWLPGRKKRDLSAAVNHQAGVAKVDSQGIPDLGDAQVYGTGNVTPCQTLYLRKDCLTLAP
ncbi:hypothetical protein [Croceicoccus gelatinilyticus]|uniref:hypothetical protein n=1 Tax=Croceicoccus gelatinilyticus TaxID=2835536 RepID=UPI001BD1304D|nr:hypothetical protein [Croceicoccus gelatinilyticus]MBS7668607.1 hypothetical protein [Croceicoccus gelatinilyticus]